MSELDDFRAEKDAFFKHDMQSPLTREQKKAFTGLNYFPEAPELRLVVSVAPAETQETIQMQTSTGAVQPYQKFGRFKFQVEGQEAELTIYGGVGPRRVSHRLRHPVPKSTEGGTAWNFRAAECDIADHVNNAAYWTPLEEELLSEPPPEPERLDVELEYRTPAQPGDKRVLRSGDRRWIVGTDGELHASFHLLA